LSAVRRHWLQVGQRRVPLLAGPNALAELPAALAEGNFQGRLFAIADSTAADLHPASLEGITDRVLTISGEEADKSLDQVCRVWDWLVEHGAERRDALVAFGGGVVCDLVGFAAATYLRGIGLVNAPTTLLAQVDASVGGKTGINHARGKNLIGAFYQPLAVVADTRLLASLPPRAFANGLAEVAKIGMVLDGDLFGSLEHAAQTGLGPDSADLLTPLIARSIELKAAVVERDEREQGERMLLNYGHTIGHALEAAAGYGSLLHGEAVAVGMEAVAHIARGMGLLDQDSADRQRALLEALRLPTRYAHVSRDQVRARLGQDKKRAGQRQRWILAERVGSGHIRDDVPDHLVEAALRSVVPDASV
jgi:shikimate kinase / 3-dehydroquinate synthase